MIRKYLKKIIVILILFIILLPYTMSFALTQAEASKTIAEYAYNFCMRLRQRI